MTYDFLIRLARLLEHLHVPRLPGWLTDRALARVAHEVLKDREP